MLERLTLTELLSYGERGEAEISEVLTEVQRRCGAGELADVMELQPKTPLTGEWLSGLPRATHYYSVEPIPALAPAGVPGDTATGVRLEFKGAPGIAIGMRGNVINGGALGVALDDIQVQLRFNDNYNATTNGQQPAFITYADLFSPTQQTWTPLLREFKSNQDVWFHDFQNLSPVAGVRPTFTYAVVRYDAGSFEVYRKLAKLYCAHAG